MPSFRSSAGAERHIAALTVRPSNVLRTPRDVALVAALAAGRGGASDEKGSKAPAASGGVRRRRQQGMDQGRIERVGGPRELYDQPANRFVMSFLGPVSQVGEERVRPHDIAISPGPEDGARQATVTRVLHLGFEVRVELQLASDGEARGDEPAGRGSGAVSAQITRHEAEALDVVDGAVPWVRTTGRTAVPA